MKNEMSNLTKRILVGIIAIPLLVFLILRGGFLFFYFTVIIEVLCLYEFYNLFNSRGLNPLKIYSIIVYTGLLCFSYFYYDKIEYIIIILIIIFSITFSIEVFRKQKYNPL